LSDSFQKKENFGGSNRESLIDSDFLAVSTDSIGPDKK
jgi:hypothetical protein